MPWFKVDDSFPSHPKVRSIPRRVRMSALGVWLACGTWSAKHLTDGLIPEDVVEDEGGKSSDAKNLVAAGLWHSNGHDCSRCEQPPKGNYLFHDWLDWQPSRTDVLTKRMEEAQRKADWRAKRTADKRAEKEKQNAARPGGVPVGQPPDGQWDSGRTDVVRPGVVPDVSQPSRTRPDPTRPDPSLPTGETKVTYSVAPDGTTGEVIRIRADAKPETPGTESPQGELFDGPPEAPSAHTQTQILVGAYCDAVTAGGGVATSSMRGAIGKNLKTLLDVDGLAPAVLLVAAQRAGAARAKNLDKYLGEAQKTFDRQGQARAAMYAAWDARAAAIDHAQHQIGA